MIGHYGNFAKAICKKCDKTIVIEIDRKRFLRNLRNGVGLYKRTHNYHCLTRNTIKVLGISENDEVEEENIIPCEISDKDYLVKNIIE